jgi:hypothetical protein
VVFTKKDATPGVAKFYIETLERIEDPVPLGNRSYRSIFVEREDAQAIWVLNPGAREPFRVSFRQGLRPPRHDDGKKKPKHGAT